MQKIVFIALLLICSRQLRAQYYYQDVLSPRQTQKEMAAYKDQGVRSVTLNSFEFDGTPSQGFYCEKKVARDYRSYEIFSRTKLTRPSTLTTSFDAQGRLLSTYDTSLISANLNQYFYNAEGKLFRTLSRITSSDDDFHNNVIEEHRYDYYPDGRLQKMYKIKNAKDTVVILFANDENNRVAIEKNTETGNKYYYFYDDKNRLTQIAQATDLRRDPYPSYVFQYNSQGLPVQMIATEEGATKNDYTLWKYTYEDGLKVTEKAYSKDRKLLGSVEYDYKKK